MIIIRRAAIFHHKILKLVVQADWTRQIVEFVPRKE